MTVVSFIGFDNHVQVSHLSDTSISVSEIETEKLLSLNFMFNLSLPGSATK